MNIIKDNDNEFRLLSLDELRPTDEGKNDILLSTTVSGNSEIEHYEKFKVFKCLRCTVEKQFHYKEDYDGDWRKIPTAWKCDRCNVNMTEIQIDKGQLRKILLTEQGTTNPIHLTGFVYGDDINKITPGIELNMKGVLRSRKKSKNDLTYFRFFDIERFKVRDENPLMPNEDEIKMFKDMDKTKLITSFAPHIRNMYLIKEGLLLCCLGGVEGEYSRGDINALLLGDPSVAKTQLLKFVTNIIKKSDYISGKSASGAGLFGGVDNLADGTRIGKPGSVTLCNGGVACIDEMEKMNPADRTYAHEVMESQTFSLRKIGIDITWTVKVSIIGAANPKKSRWTTELSIKENVTMPDSLLSRFGLIFLIRDIPNKEEDLLIAEHIAKVRRGKIDIELTPEDLMKFINYAKTIFPKEDDEASKTLTDWWSSLREVSQADGSIAIDFRTIEDLHRLTEAYARMDLSEVATISHANRAIKMLNDSLHTLGMNTPGEKNISVVETMSKIQYFEYVFKEPRTMIKAITLLCEKQKWFNEWSAEKMIQDFHIKGKLIETGGEYSWV
jgi:replicative DNA helicase Mcm